MLAETNIKEPEITISPDSKQAQLRPIEIEAGLALALLVVALLLRLATLNVNSLSFDEAIRLRLADETSLKELLFYHRSWLLQPPLYLIVVHLWTKFFGVGELAARLFPLVMSVANLGLVYLLMRPRFGQRIALTALLLLAFSPLDLYWSQTIRLGTLVSLLATLSFGLALFASDKPAQNWRWVLYGLSTLGLVYTSYLGWHVALAEAVFLVITFFKNRGVLLRLGITLLLVALAFLPYLGNALEQFNAAGPIFSFNPGPVQMVEAVQQLAWYSKLDWLVPLAGACFVPLYLIGLAWLWQTRRTLAIWLLCWSLLPVITAWLGSLFRSNFVTYEYSFCLPPFMVMTAAGVWRLSAISRPRWSYIMLGLVLLLDLSACLDYYQNYHTPDFRSAVSFLNQNRQDGDLLFLANGYGYTSWVVDYYMRMEDASAWISHGSLPDVPATGQLADLLKDRRRVWLLSFDDGTNWAEKYVYPYLPANLKVVSSRTYNSTDQGSFTLTLYTNTP